MPTKPQKASAIRWGLSVKGHAAKNVGKVNGAELATYIVEKGKPLITLVK